MLEPFHCQYAAHLVEVAERCQVSIIHPKKPRNAKEAGLVELLKRAEVFM